MCEEDDVNHETNSGTVSERILWSGSGYRRNSSVANVGRLKNVSVHDDERNKVLV